MQKECPFPLQKVFSNLAPYLKKDSPFSDASQQGMYEAMFQTLPQYEILVVGAGGLGCEIVKNLAVSGIRNIHLIDMDTIDLTNLNRQFLFRQKDVGKMKAEVVADFVMRRCPGVKVIPHTCRVQQKDFNFYTKFNVIIGGLDNVEARKFLNSMVHQLNLESEQTCCFYIDGATEGFEGQCLVVEPFKTSCYSCSLLEGLDNKPKANYCTIANTPRTPQHCIQYILEVEWEKEYPHTKRDNDNLEHMKWIYQKSLARAQQFNIEGVTEMLTLGVTKNIIPAIASTNAFIAAACTNQAIKLITNANPIIKNYLFYKGGTSIGSDTYLIQKREGCHSCLMKANKLEPINLKVQEETLFSQILDRVGEENSVISKRPFVNIDGTIFYNPSDKARASEKQNMTVSDLKNAQKFTSNPQIIVITDQNLKDQLKVILHIQ